MTDLVLSLFAGILALNAVALGAFAVAVAIEARRRKVEIRRLQSLRRIEAERPRSERVVVPFVRASAAPRVLRGRSSASRAVAILMVGAILCGGGTALASPHTRQAAASAFVAITHALTSDPRERVAADATPERTPSSSPSRLPSTVAPSAPILRPPTVDMGTQPHYVERPLPVASSTSATQAPVESPAPPEGVSVVASSSSQIEVSWTGVDGAAAYRVERSTDGIGDWSTVADEVQAGATTYVDGELSADATYYYRVYSIGTGGSSAASDIVSATTLTAPPPAPVVTATASSSSEIVLSWPDVEGETGYRIERSTDGTNWSSIGTTGADVTTYTDGDLAPGTSFSYRVFATNAGGDSPPSEVVSATTPDASVDPSSVSAVVGSGTVVDVSWMAGAGADS